MRTTIKYAMAALWFGFLGPSQLGILAAHAQDTDTSAVTTAGAEEVTRGYLKDEAFSVKPNLGIVAFKDALNNNTSRGSMGFGLEWNSTKSFGIDPSWYTGIASGLEYSHLGAASANFVGSNPSQTAEGPASIQGSNLLMIPANLKIGYNFTDYYRLAVHGGGNIIYKSVANSINLASNSTDVGNGSSTWGIYPNVGADIDVALGRNVSLAIRPDVTLAPANAFFVGTLGVGINMG